MYLLVPFLQGLHQLVCVAIRIWRHRNVQRQRFGTDGASVIVHNFGRDQVVPGGAKQVLLGPPLAPLPLPREKRICVHRRYPRWSVALAAWQPTDEWHPVHPAHRPPTLRA